MKFCKFQEPTSYWSQIFENKPLRDFDLRFAAIDCKQLFTLCYSEHFYVFWLKNTFVFLFQVGERIRVILDCDDNTLAFERNYEFLGVAFRGKFLKFLIHCVPTSTCISETFFYKTNEIFSELQYLVGSGGPKQFFKASTLLLTNHRIVEQ